MSKTGCKVAMIMALAVLLLAGQAFAAPGGPGPGPRGGRGFRGGFGRGLGAGPGRGLGAGPGLCPWGGPGFGGGGPGPFGMGAGGPNPGWRGGLGEPMMLGRILRGLDLTDEQTQMIKEILEGARADMEAVREAIGEAAKALREAVMQGAEEAAIREAATALGKAIGDQAVLKAKVMASVKDVLTEEQIAELDEIKARLGEMRGKMTAPGFGRSFGRFGQRRGLQGYGRYGRRGWGPRFGGPGPGATEQGLGKAPGKTEEQSQEK